MGVLSTPIMAAAMATGDKCSEKVEGKEAFWKTTVQVQLWEGEVEKVDIRVDEKGVRRGGYRQKI
jgi:hypothetical protein